MPAIRPCAAASSYPDVPFICPAKNKPDKIFVSKEDSILINESFGYLTYDGKNKVTNETIYDIASLTKIIATTPIIMKLVQKKYLGVDFPLLDFYNEFDVFKGFISI